MKQYEEMLESNLEKYSKEVFEGLGIEVTNSEHLFNLIHYIDTEVEMEDEYLYILSHPPKDIPKYLRGLKNYITTFYLYKEMIFEKNRYILTPIVEELGKKFDLTKKRR